MTVVDHFTISSDHVPFMLQGIPTVQHEYSDPERTSGWPHEKGLMGDRLSWRETVEDTIDKTNPEFVRRDAITFARVAMRVVNSDEILARRMIMEETTKLIEERGFLERLYELYYKTPEELVKHGLSSDMA